MPITRAYGQASQLGNTPAASNPVINGGFDIWQRGTSSTDTNGDGKFIADRWQFYSASTGRTFSRQTTSDTTNLPNIQYCMRVARNSGNTNTSFMNIGQNIETVNSIPYAGKTVTLSFYARAGANYSAASNALGVLLGTGTGTDQDYVYDGYTGSAAPINATATLTTTWQRFSFTGTIAATATEMCPLFSFTPTGTAGANDYFEFTGVQIDIGSVALPFRRAGGNIAGELAACKRYYWRRTGAQYLGTGYAQSSTWGDFVIQYDQMRAAPTLSANTGTNYFNYQIYGVDGLSTTIGAFYSVSAWSCLARTTTSSLTAGAAGRGGIENASGYLEASAEL